jgi:hypothetical protein
MAKMCGNGADFALVKQERSRTIVGYELRRMEGSALSEWHEVYFPRKVVDLPSIEQVRKAVEDDINAQTDAKIVSDFVWTPKAGGDPIPVWLSTENQFNFKSAYDLAVQKNGATLPVTFKMGERNGVPVYHSFETMEEAEDFYVHAVAFINHTLTEGWTKKDSTDWTPYEQALQNLE